MGPFLDMKKACDAMDRERCIWILEGNWVQALHDQIDPEFLAQRSFGLPSIWELWDTFSGGPQCEAGWTSVRQTLQRPS
jgi:hypothetical protein